MKSLSRAPELRVGTVTNFSLNDSVFYRIEYVWIGSGGAGGPQLLASPGMEPLSHKPGSAAGDGMRDAGMVLLLRGRGSLAGT